MSGQRIMKVFIAGFDTETNTFAPIPTGYQNFAETFLAHGDATRRPVNYCSNQLVIWRREAEARGWDVAEGLCTYAEPGGRIVASAYATLRDELLDESAPGDAGRHRAARAAWRDGGRGMR